MKKLLLLTLILLQAGFLRAQYQIGHSISNYGGTNSLYFNPSNVVDGRYKFYMNFVGLNVHMSNDYISWNAPYHPFGALGYSVPGMGFFNGLYKVPSSAIDANDNLLFEESWLNENLNGKPKNALMQMEYRSFSFMFNIGQRHSIAVGSRVRAMAQMTNVTEPLARIIRYGFDTASTPFRNGELSLDQLYGSNSFNINIAAFTELSLSYGAVLMDQDEHFLKGGITGKYFVPMYGAYMRNSDIDVTILGEDSFEFRNTNIEYGYTSEKYYNNMNSGLFGLGGGLGMDIGFTYEYRPDYKKYKYQMNGKEKYDRSKNKYLFKIQASFNDLGAVKFDNTDFVRAYQLENRAVVTFTPDLLDTLQMFRDRYGDDGGTLLAVDSMIGRLVGFENASNTFDFKLPSNLNISADYRVLNNVYLNLLWIQSLRTKQVNGLRGFSLLALTPRYESKWFGASLPIQLTQNYSKVRLGMHLRGGPFWFGTDNLSGLISKKDITGADIYFGLSIPIYQRKERDRDKDGVSNKYDKCRDVPGIWEFRGCPDTDEDGTPDSKDSCVTIPGPKELNGCPDRDHDAVYDHNDSCPDIAGLPIYNGCPDTDGDSIIDSEDACPDAAGPIETNGCPDRDGDGVLDAVDQCVDEKGSPELNGCPDRDRDGVADKADKCPDTPGLTLFAGCPDTDKDSVPDNVDLCPLEKGTPENNGCPKVEEKIDILDIPEEDQEILNEVFSNLEFATGSAEIDPKSYQSLDRLAELLDKRPTYRIYIAGHTDNTGNQKLNEKLSAERAESVRKYLEEKGIQSIRIKTEGFGSSRPVADNNTPEGRQKNRRVEFRVIK